MVGFVSDSSKWIGRSRCGATDQRHSSPIQEHGKTQDDVTETLIRKRVEDFAKAIGAKDIDRVMALYARDLVSFDLTPPLRRFGADEKRRAWQDAFAALSGPVAYDVRDLDVTTNGEVAFVHSLKIGRAHV